MTELDRHIRSLRPAKAQHDPWRAQGFTLELETQRSGCSWPSLTLFLTGRECPFTCVFCDLWQYTTDKRTPLGAIPAQIKEVLAEVSAAQLKDVRQIKLYNASNFFDEQAVPAADDAAIAALTRPFTRVVVESHAKLIGRRALEFGEALNGRLQVALGFETVDQKALARLNKGLEVADLEKASALLRSRNIGLRAFVLIGTPFVSQKKQIAMTARTVEFALEQGAELVSLIPLRTAPGIMLELERQGDFRPPSRQLIVEAFARCQRLDPDRVRLDPWAHDIAWDHDSN